jgi:hypothetical protein
MAGAPIQPETLKYPVLCLSRDNSVSVTASSEHLRRCNATAWFRNRYFEDLRVVDASATPYRVRSAALVVTLSAWRRILVRLLNRRLVVTLELEVLAPPSLAEAKRTVTAWLHRAPDFWEASRDLPEWEHLVSHAPSMEALCSLFA